ncbi:hypothetical protein K474DRAFT_1703922 [Panus rudis PR-1116 ss-1]|nr:hypothetical protein K474DRAFT_1703922 [Panus rudis PR-1116 ss-1]
MVFIYKFNACSFGDHRTISLTTVLSLLELGTKYQMEHHKEEAMRRMKQLFPASLDDFPHEYLIYEEVPKDARKVPITTDFQTCFVAVTLVRRLNLISFLPPLLYVCVHSPVDTMCSAVASGKWNIDDLQLCMQGIEPLMNARLAGYAPLYRHELNGNCSTSNKCRSSIVKLLSRKGGMYQVAWDVLFTDAALTSFRESEMCQKCYRHYEAVFNTLRRDVWGKLGGYFGVEPWPPVDKFEQAQ